MKLANLLIVCDCPRVMRFFIINCLSPRLRHICAIVMSVLLVQSQTALTMKTADPKGMGNCRGGAGWWGDNRAWLQSHTI